MYKQNEWNENEKFFLNKIVQNIIGQDNNPILNQETTSSCSSEVKTSCCIDTTKIVTGPCGGEIRTSCCIDTTKE